MSAQFSSSAGRDEQDEGEASFPSSSSPSDATSATSTGTVSQSGSSSGNGSGIGSSTAASGDASSSLSHQHISAHGPIDAHAPVVNDSRADAAPSGDATSPPSVLTSASASAGATSVLVGVAPRHANPMQGAVPVPGPHAGFAAGPAAMPPGPGLRAPAPMHAYYQRNGGAGITPMAPMPAMPMHAYYQRHGGAGITPMAPMSAMPMPEQLRAIASLLADAAEECAEIDVDDSDPEADPAAGYVEDDAGDADLHGSDMENGDEEADGGGMVDADADASAVAASLGELAATAVAAASAGSEDALVEARKGKMNAAERQKVRGKDHLSVASVVVAPHSLVRASPSVAVACSSGFCLNCARARRAFSIVCSAFPS